MELDELKQKWQDEPVKNKSNTDIMELIQQKSYGPLAALKSTYRKQIIAMAILPALLLFLNMGEGVQKVLTSVLFWSYVGFCICTVLFARYNLRIVKEMERMDGMVKANLENRIALLRKSANLEIVYFRCVLIFFAVLIEILPYFQHYRVLDKWHSLPSWIRISAYTALFLLQYFLNRRIKEKRVGQHLTYLKEVVREMQ